MADPFDTIPQLQYDIRAAQKAGLTEADIAQYASKRRNYDYQSARKAGLTDADLIRHNIANVSESGAGGAFVEEALTAVPVSIAMGAGTAAGYGAGLAGAAALGLTGPVGLGVAVLSGLTGLIASGGLATAAIDKVKDVTGLGGEQYVPSAQVGAIAGETVGFVTGMGLPTLARGVAAKLGGTSVGKAFGFKELGPEVAKAGDELFLPAGVKPVDLGYSVLFANAASSPRLASAVKNLEITLSRSKASRTISPGKSLVKDTAIAGYMGAYGAGAEAIDPGNVPLRVTAEVVGGIFNPAQLINAFGSRIANAAKKGFNKVMPGGPDAETTRMVATLQKMVDDVARDGVNVDLKKSIEELEKGLPDVLKTTSSSAEGPTKELAEKIPQLNIVGKTSDRLVGIIGSAITNMKGGESKELALRSLSQTRKTAQNLGYIIEELSTVQSPMLQSELSRLTESVYKAGMEGVLDTAVLNATSYANMISKRTEGRRRAVEGTEDGKTVFTPGGEFIGDKTNAGKVLIETLFDAAKASRKIEQSKWDLVGKKIPVNIGEILNFYDRKVLPSEAFGGSVAEVKNLVPYLPTWVKEQREISMAVLNEERAVQRAPFEEQLAKLKVQQETAVKEVPKTSNQYDPTFLGRKDAALRKVKALGDGIDSAKREIEALKPYTLATLPNELVTSTVGRVQQFRSTNLANGRVTAPTALGAPQSGFYNKMAEKALDDLNAGGTALDKRNQRLYDDARAFSKAFNDVFSRGFGGEIIKKTADGGDRTTPESIANTLITTSGNTTVARLNELESALDFIIKRTPDPVERQRFQALKKYDYRGATEIILRDLLSKNVIISSTGEINRLKLSNALREYKDVFAIPGMKALETDLNNAKTAKILLDKVRRDVKTTGYKPTEDGLITNRDVPKRGKFVEGTAFGKSEQEVDAFRRFLGNEESPTSTIIKIRFNHDNPGKELTALSGLTKQGLQKGQVSPEEFKAFEALGDPVKGFQTVVVNSAVENSRRADGTVDFVKFREFLLEPMRGKGSTSMADVLKRNEILSAKELENLIILADYGQRTQGILDNSASREAAIAALEMSGNMLSQAAARITGASTVSSLSAKALGMFGINRSGGLVEANIGAELAGKYFNALPYAAQQRLFFDAYNNPQLMADMLKKIKKPIDIQKFHKQNQPVLESLLGLEAYREISEEIKRDGFFEEEVTEEVIEQPVPMAMAPAPQRSEPLVDTNVREMAMAPTPPPPAQRQQARPASAPTNRSQYAAMFPYDTASEVIRSQEGIASLMT
jgi:hypothetical protein